MSNCAILSARSYPSESPVRDVWGQAERKRRLGQTISPRTSLYRLVEVINANSATLEEEFRILAVKKRDAISIKNEATRSLLTNRLSSAQLKFRNFCMRPMSITACLSHKEDVDGILSAVLIKAAFNAKFIILVDYPNIISSLDRLATADFLPKLDRIFVSDLGLSKKNEGEFMASISKIISNGPEVIYIDHHDLNRETIFALKKMGVLMIHSVEECSSVQIYNKFKKKLKPHAAFFAAASSLTDYMENKPMASAIVSRYDRQFLMLESTVLSYIISAKQHDDEFLIQIVNFLSDMKYPHDIEGGFSIAERYAKKVSDAIKKIEGSITKSDNIAYVQSNSALSASMIVNFVLGISERPVAMVYKLKDEIDSYIFSIRGNKSCKVHLGRAVNQISSEIGGSGGGHEKACGAVVPREKLKQFIYLLDRLAA